MRQFASFSFFLFLIIGAHFSCINVFGQADTVAIPLFEVVDFEMKDEVAGTQNTRFNLSSEVLKRGADISDLLQNQSTAVMRGYGPGSSYGLSIRGAGTGQSQVLIDGIPFENPSLGSTDLSLLPMAIFSDAQLYRGGASAYLGNATIGGSLMLNTTADSGKSFISQYFSAGSFGKIGSVTQAQFSLGRLQSNTVFYYREAQNDFLRDDPSKRGEREKQPNAFAKSRGLLQRFDYKFNQQSKAGIFLWVNETNRQIPPNFTRPDSDAHQDDENLRVQGNFSHEWKRFQLDVSASVDRGALNYFDAGLEDYSEFETYHAQAKISKSLDKWEAYAMAVFHDAHAETDDYQSAETRSSPALVAGWVSKFFENKTRISLTVRQEFLNGNSLPVVPVLGFEQKLFKQFSLHGSAGKSYRIPGLNDLFWIPGGNPDLKPESGWFQELGASFQKSGKNSSFTSSLTGFHREIENWIQWQPGASYWSVVNLKKVRSYGAELELSLNQNLNRFSLIHQASLLYVKSINAATSSDDRTADKQLIYTPEFVISASETVLYRGFRLRALGYFESERFTTSDNSKYLDPYFLLDAELSKAFKLSNYHIDIFGAVRNLLDSDYQLKASHTMPGVNFEIGIKLNYKLKSKNKNED